MPAAPANPPTPPQENILLSWTAPARPFKKRSKDFYISVMTITALVGLVLFLVEGLMPIVLLVSLVFLFYVMSTVEPDQVEYQITNLGVKVSNVRNDWANLGRFWFSSRFGSEMLIIESRSISGRIEMVVKKELKEQIKSTMAKYVVYEEIPASTWDRAASWISKFIPD